MRPVLVRILASIFGIWTDGPLCCFAVRVMVRINAVCGFVGGINPFAVKWELGRARLSRSYSYVIVD